jgi:nucleotide-binding universal stress UspA family protein
VSEDQDWRLTAELDAADRRGALERLLGRVRGPDVVEEIEAALPRDVVITHDGKLLFAYAASEEEIQAACRVIEDVLRREGINATIVVSHWDEDRDAWQQVDPPPSTEDASNEEAAERDADALETRTLVASAGKLVRPSFEQSLLEWADKLGIKCTIVEHPHLLTTQVLFTCTGPKRKIDEFARALKAEGTATLRADGILMLNPL